MSEEIVKDVNEDMKSDEVEIEETEGELKNEDLDDVSGGLVRVYIR